jgi:hypothetical protein
MKIYDNFLQEKNHNKLWRSLINEDFNWSYSNGIDYDKQPNLYQFCHVFYDHGDSIIEDTTDKIRSLHGDISFLRIKSNLNPSTSDHIQLGAYHVDIPNVNTAIYYVNDNNGYTIFENGEKVRSVANRLVVFDSNTKHVGFSCTDEKIRIVINFNFENSNYDWDSMVPDFLKP